MCTSKMVLLLIMFVRNIMNDLITVKSSVHLKHNVSFTIPVYYPASMITDRITLPHLLTCIDYSEHGQILTVAMPTQRLCLSLDV